MPSRFFPNLGHICIISTAWIFLRTMSSQIELVYISENFVDWGTVQSCLFPNWKSNLKSDSHHSFVDEFYLKD